MTDVPQLLQHHATRVAAFLGRSLDRYTTAPTTLIEAMRYSLLSGGKCLRPTLILETFRAIENRFNNDPPAGNLSQTPSGRPRNDSEMPESVLAAAAAMELIHTFSLVHDDLPAMDNDDLRRGRPTNHKVFGEAMAILAGDAMITHAFEILARHSRPELLPRLITELAGAAGAEGMIGGQVLDMDGENKSLDLAGLQLIHRLKTGALLTASCRIGAICAGAGDAELPAITRFGQHLGLAFQIKDDLLDETATAEQLGKAVGKDRSRGKNTYPALLGVTGAEEQARRQTELAIESLSDLGDRAAGLRAIANYSLQRMR